MRLLDILSYSFNSLRHRRARAWLTILGIVIGIASVVALLTIGQGFQDEVNRQLGQLGSRTIFIAPIAGGASAAFTAGASPSSGKLYQKDYERLQRISEIEDIARLLMGRAVLQFKDKEISSTVYGAEPGVFEKTMAIEMENGRFLAGGDRHVAVIGSNVAESAFGQNNKVSVNSYLVINGQKFRVIGVIKKSGSSLTGGRVDNAIYVHFEDAQQLFRYTFGPNDLGATAVLLREGADSDEATEQIYAELDASRKVQPDERDYSVVNPKTIQASVNEVIGLLTLFLGAIAGISLVVGGLAIASAMFTSVIERTKEIGILKSVGATNGDIMKLFVIEAGAIGGIGGAVGAALGVGIVYLVSLFGLPAAINPLIALFGFFFAIAVGLASGYIPAKSAAKLSPVDALRYE